MKTQIRNREPEQGEVLTGPDIIARQRVYRTVRSILDYNGLLLYRIRPLFSNECLIHWHRKDKELRINVDIMAELSDDTIGRIVRSFL